jgi:hypothetical protein
MRAGHTYVDEWNWIIVQWLLVFELGDVVIMCMGAVVLSSM